MIDLSLNEAAALSKSAARGAGWPWAVAEDLGHAVRWLTAQGLDGAEALLILARQGTDGLDDATAILSAGDTLALAPQDHHRFGPVSAPVLMLPLIAEAAQAHRVILSARIGPASLTTDGAALWHDGPAAIDGRDVIEVHRAQRPATAPVSRRTRAPLTAACHEELRALASRTYAPATEESRRLGAGADG